MKRAMRQEKLVVRRDTIRELHSDDLERARGGESNGAACTQGSGVAPQTQAPKL